MESGQEGSSDGRFPDSSLAVQDYRPRGSSGAVFREAWKFKGDAIARIVQLLDGAPRPWVHVCCGAAVIPGEDLRVDLYHPSADHAWDVQDLDRHLSGVGAIMIDPPYGWDLAARMRAMYACARALAPGGVLVVHAPWQPQFPRRYMTRRDPVLYRDDGGVDFPMPPVLLCRYKKSSDPSFGRDGPRAHRRERLRRGKGVRA